LDRLSVLEDEEEEDVPITDMKITPPPPPPAPQVIEVVEDDEEVEETTVIESTETDQEQIIKLEDVAIEDDFDEVDVPFAVIEDVPVFPGCERVAKSKRRDCFQEKINIHIRKNFRYPEIAQEMGASRKSICEFYYF